MGDSSGQMHGILAITQKLNFIENIYKKLNNFEMDGHLHKFLTELSLLSRRARHQIRGRKERGRGREGEISDQTTWIHSFLCEMIGGEGKRNLGQEAQGSPKGILIGVLWKIFPFSVSAPSFLPLYAI